MPAQAIESGIRKSVARPVVSAAPEAPAPARHSVTVSAQKAVPNAVPAAAALIAAALLAVVLHRVVPNRQSDEPTRLFPLLLNSVLGVGVFGLALQWVSRGARRAVRHYAPLLAAATLTLCAWDLITLKFDVLPLPYFPGPDLVLESLRQDWKELLVSAGRSLLLLSTGYTMGCVVGVTCGVLIGWSPRVRYWGMPLLKILGPVPATALVPLAMILFPTAFWSGAALIAAAVWFPVTMLTSSGIANVRLSYLDVARTLGAGRAYLVFRVAIPAALPSIFVGLFMGLGASFLTLIVAEAVGAKSGLGWYIDWAKIWADYAKVYAALIIMSAFFSGIMTLLFKVRDWALEWQKGVIKW